MSEDNKSKREIIDIITGVSALLFYFIASALQTLPFELLKIDINSLPMYIRVLYSLGYELFIIFVVVLLFNKKLRKDFKDIKLNHNEYFKNTFRYYVIAFIVMVVSNIILAIITGGIAGNEEEVEKLIVEHPIYMWISAVLLAPVLEELLFRQGIRNIFKNKWLFILISGLLFGGMHVIGSSDTIIDYFYIIPYSSFGIAFAYMLYKYDNIFVSIGYHFMHNGILVSLQLLLLLIS